MDASRASASWSTGGDSGIGRAVAVVCAKEGADVAIAHLPQEQDDADETLRLVEAAGRRGFSFPGDLRTEEANATLARDATAALGGLDVLVCNAAFQMTHDDLEAFPREQVQQTFETERLLAVLAGPLPRGRAVGRRQHRHDHLRAGLRPE